MSLWVADLRQKPYVGSAFQSGLCARMSRSVVQYSLLQSADQESNRCQYGIGNRCDTCVSTYEFYRTDMEYFQ